MTGSSSPMSHDSQAAFDFAAVIAGVRIRSNRPLTGLSIDGDAYLDLEICFGRATSVPCVPPVGAHALPECIQLTGWIAADGLRAFVAEPPARNFEVPLSIRRVLPFASALQGGVILHGSAVALPAGVHVFVAASATGKSTLAAQLGSLGLPVVADDLTPCRLVDGQVEVPLPSEAKRDGQSARLCGVHFLSRSSLVDRVNLTPLTPARCVAQLLWNGFSELAVPELWASQFRSYSKIARGVPAYALAVPDDRRQIGPIAKDVRAALDALSLPESA
jgi:hypothetical protein